MRAPLEDYLRRHPAHAETTTRFLDLLTQAGDAAFARDHFIPGHITGSALILDAAHQRTLLTHHKKLGIWVQPGGHCDGLPDARATALREAREETGLLHLTLATDHIFDLDIHEIPARKADPAHLHFDVRYLLTAHPDHERFTVSEESHALAWVPLQDISTKSTDASILRMIQRLSPPSQPSQTHKEIQGYSG